MQPTRDIASVIFQDPNRIKQLVATGYRVLLMGPALYALASNSYISTTAGSKNRLYFIFAPPALDGTVWGRHVDVYLNDIMNSPAPSYGHTDPADSMWLPMRVEFADTWDGVMLNHTYLPEVHNTVRLGKAFEQEVTTSWFDRPLFYYGVMDEKGILKDRLPHVSEGPIFGSVVHDVGKAVTVSRLGPGGLAIYT
ncbi:hypothetical protein PLICBS_004157 [Purpureocillium lilacinum]|uniref:uncharacterized protein n=1 Tax=Purpureocillium lilacinum TaxID=33203 RepID=UPI00208C6C9D|nr:hypothetical protein PLICBS_004157 [Purpureocillium lilacinum]